MPRTAVDQQQQKLLNKTELTANPLRCSDSLIIEMAANERVLCWLY